MNTGLPLHTLIFICIQFFECPINLVKLWMAWWLVSIQKLQGSTTSKVWFEMWHSQLLLQCLTNFIGQKIKREQGKKLFSNYFLVVSILWWYGTSSFFLDTSITFFTTDKHCVTLNAFYCCYIVLTVALFILLVLILVAYILLLAALFNHDECYIEPACVLFALQCLSFLTHSLNTKNIHVSCFFA